MSAIAARRTAGGGGPPPNIVVSATTTGSNAGGGTTATITLPAYTAGDYLALIVARNQTSTTWTGDGSASLTEVRETGATRRLTLLKVNPTGSPSTFVLTASVTGVWSWCCMNLGAITPTISTNADDPGTNATSAIVVPAVTTSVTDGHELQIIAACTNSTAIWTAPATPAGQTVRCNYTAAPGLFVATAPCASGQTSIATADIDRGNNGTSRNEQVLVAVYR